MIGFWMVNLLPPGAVKNFDLRTPSGVWTFNKAPNFDELAPKIKNSGACGNTYSMMFSLPDDATRSSIMDSAFDEVLPICLAASFVTGMSVTIRNSVEFSEIKFIQTGAHFLRDRGLTDTNYCVSTLDQFVQFVEIFVSKYPALDQSEKLRLLMHFFVDSLSCWSLENLYLSGSTLLQIIASTEESSGRSFSASHAIQRNGPMSKPAFFDFLAGAADRVGIAPLGHDVVKTRNSLIHDGTLHSLKIPSQVDAAKPISEAMMWVDDYIYALLGLGKVPLQRHAHQDFAYSLNSFSF